MADKRYANSNWDSLKETFGGKASPDVYEGRADVPVGYYGLDMGAGKSLTDTYADTNFVEAGGRPGHGATGLDYGSPTGSGYNAYPGAGAGVNPEPYTGPGPQVSGGTAAVNGAAQGSAFGPWGAAIGAVLGVLTSVKQQKEQAKAAETAYKLQQKSTAQAAQREGEDKKSSAAGAYGSNTQSAMNQLLGVFRSTQRG